MLNGESKRKADPSPNPKRTSKELLRNLGLSSFAFKNDLIQLIRMEFSEQYHDLHSENSAYNMSLQKQRTPKLFLTIAVLTVAMSAFQTLAHYDASSEITTYYIYQLTHSILQFVFVHSVLAYQRQRTSLLQWQGTSKLSNYWLVLVMHALTIFVRGMNASHRSTNAGGSEFSQMSVVLIIPAAIIWSNHLLPKQISGITTTLLSCSAAVQLVVFCKDRALSSSVSVIIGCMVYSIGFGLYMVLLKMSLSKDSILQLIYRLTFVEIPLHVILAILNNNGMNDEILAVNFQTILAAAWKLFRLIFYGFINMVLSLLLLKMSDPLTYLVTVNISLIPCTIYKIFHYKLEFYLSTLKCALFFIISLVINAFKNRTFQQ